MASSPIWEFPLIRLIHHNVVFLPALMDRWICVWIRTIANTAAKILNEYSETQLHKIFGMYGELKNAKTAAKVVIQHRVEKPFVRTAGSQGSPPGHHTSWKGE